MERTKSILKSFHGLSLIGKSEHVYLRVSAGGNSKPTYIGMEPKRGESSAGRTELPLNEGPGVFGKHLRPLVVKLMELDTHINPGLTLKERVWVLESALVIIKYYISAFVDCGFPLCIEWRSLDLSFGLDEITDLDTFKSKIKASLVWPVSCLLGNKLAATLPFKGRARKYIKNVLRTRLSLKKLSLVQTILIGVKVCAPKVPNSMILSNQQGCVERSTAPPRQTDSQIQCVLRECDRMLVGFNSSGVLDAVSNFSLRSNLESNRENEGSYGMAKDLFGVEEVTSVIHGGSIDETGVQPVDLDDFMLEAGFHRVTQSDGKFEERNYFNPDLSGSETDLITPTFFVPVGYTDRDDYFSRIPRAPNPLTELPLDDIAPYNTAQTGRPILKREVIGLPEPLKVRCITLSHWWESPLWAKLQKRSIQFLGRNKFVASGKVLETEYFSSIARKVKELEKRLGLEFVFISDDGDAATDSISLPLSNGSMRSIVPDELKDVYDLTSGITGDTYVRIKRKVKKGEVPEYTRQTNSQYMGSRLSFAQLTIIHASYKKTFLRRYKHLYGLTERDINALFFVNGDDGVIALPRILVEPYFKWMNTLWNLNVIKTQIHRDVFTINSRMFKINADRETFTEVNFFRYNLIERQDRHGDRILDPQVWNVFSETAGPLMEPNLLWDKFHREWSGTLKYLTKGKGNNYFLPTVFGGLGMVPLPGQNWYTNSRQRYAIVQTLKRKGKELPPPRWRTTIVPIIKHSGVSRSTRRALKQGLSSTAVAPSFEGTASVKGITTSTKLFTRRLPRGNHVPQLNVTRFDLLDLTYGELREDSLKSNRLVDVALNLAEALRGLLKE